MLLGSRQFTVRTSLLLIMNQVEITKMFLFRSHIKYGRIPTKTFLMSLCFVHTAISLSCILVESRLA